jgi:hypothetical protein
MMELIYGIPQKQESSGWKEPVEMNIKMCLFAGINL